MSEFRTTGRRGKGSKFEQISEKLIVQFFIKHAFVPQHDSVF